MQCNAESKAVMVFHPQLEQESAIQQVEAVTAPSEDMIRTALFEMDHFLIQTLFEKIVMGN